MKKWMTIAAMALCVLTAMSVFPSARAEMNATLVGNEKTGYMIGEGIWADFVSTNLSEEERQRQYMITGFSQYCNLDYGMMILTMRGYDASSFGGLDKKEKMEAILFGACDILAPLYEEPYLDRLNVYTRDDGVSIGIFYFADIATGRVSNIMLLAVIIDTDGDAYLYEFEGIPDDDMVEPANMVGRMIDSFCAEFPIR